MGDTSETESRFIKPIDVSRDELNFRSGKYKDLDEVLEEELLCTICSENLKEVVARGKTIECHPHLEVLLCEDCRQFYGLGEFSPDEDGSDKYCRWCGQGGKLYCCSKCVSAFCRKCLKRNLNQKFLKNLEDDDWECIMCNPKPIFPHRAVCKAAIMYARQKKHDIKEKRTEKLVKISERMSSKSGRAERRANKVREPAVKEDKDSNLSKPSSDGKYQTVIEISDESDSMPLRNHRLPKVPKSKEKVGVPKVKRMSSYEFSDSDFEPRHSQKPRKNIRPNDQQMQLGEPKAPHNQKNTSEVKGKASASRSSLDMKEVNRLCTVLDGLVDDCDCIGRLMIQRLDSLREKYFSGSEFSEALVGVVKSKMLRLAENSMNSLNRLIEDINQLGDPVGKNAIHQQDNLAVKTEDVPEAEEGDLSDVSHQKVKRCGSVTSEEENSQNVCPDTPRACSEEADEEDPDCVGPEENANDFDKVSAKSEDLFEDDDSSANMDVASVPLSSDSLVMKENSLTANLLEDDGSKANMNDTSVPLSKDSLALKAKLLANLDSDSDSESCGKSPIPSRAGSESDDSTKETASVSLPNKRSATDCEASNMSSSSGSESKSSRSVGKFQKKRLSSSSVVPASLSDIKSCHVSIKRMEKATEQEYLCRFDNYCRENGLNEDSDDSVDKLTNLASLRRGKRNPAEKTGNSVYTSNDSKKKNDDESNKACLNDFYGQLDSDVSSDGENNKIDLKDQVVTNNLPSRNDLHKAMLLKSSDSEDASPEDHEEEMGKKEFTSKKQTQSSPQEEENSVVDSHGSGNADHNSSNDENEKVKNSWRRDKLLTQKLSESDTSDDERRLKKKLLRGESTSREIKTKSDTVCKNNRKSRSAKSGSDGSCYRSQSSSSEDFVKVKRKRPTKKSSSLSSSSETDSSKPKKKKFRKRIKTMKSSSDSDELSEAKGEESPTKGRKKIRKVIKENDLEENTKAAAKEEEERRQRIAERNRKFNETYENRQKEFQIVDKLVLDFDEQTKEPLVQVHSELVKKLKPHQVEGVKFMWDACFESIERIKKSNGSGSILAHCMGLGKTLQVITLLHTLFSHPDTKVHTALIVCPLSTVLNWVNEFDKWLSDLQDRPISVFELTRSKKNYERQYKLKEWQEEGGVLVIGYEMFRNLCNPESKKVRPNILKTFQSTLINPGPDIVICDEGHLLKNEDTAISKAMSRVKTLRRIVLTGTPLQNNLKEYHCMVQFVKPNLLGTRKEFLNRFVNPITNGQFEDSTSHDVRTMKRRAHVLHKTLEGSVQRFDYSVLTPFLPEKQEYVILVRLTELQEKLYKHFLDNFSSRGLQGKGAQLFNDFQHFQRIWTHPRVLKMSAERNELKAERKLQDEDSEGSLRDFIDDSNSDKTSSEETSSDDDDDDDVKCLDDEDSGPKKKPTRKLRSNKETFPDSDPELPMERTKREWWEEFVKDEDFEDVRASPKLVLLFSILKECEEMGDKLLVFSQSLFSLDLIEYFLNKLDEATQNESQDGYLDDIKASWVKGIDYFRLDGQTPTDIRSIWCKSFNNVSNLRGRLFLISTKAGGLGINLVAANRVIIFDASWNPSHDVQSIFRVYRFGQKKPCFIYRFLAQGTMEEKIYERQVTKLSLACRVVDEQQIERHYNMADLQELYRFNPADRNTHEKPKLPKDGLFAEILKAHEGVIISYHEHDSLLENKQDEELNEEERQAAWEDYENEKKGRANIQLFEANPSIEQLREVLRNKDPGATEEELQARAMAVYQQMARQQQQQQMMLYRRQQQQELLRMQQMQMLQQLSTEYQTVDQRQQYLPQLLQYPQYPAPIPNPAFQPINNRIHFPSTSSSSTGPKNFQHEA